MHRNFIEKLRGLAVEFFALGAIQVGEYATRTGIVSPIYIDLKMIVSHPSLMNKICKLLWSLVENPPDAVQLCGVPYTGIIMASFISQDTRKRMIIRRNEPESGGMRRQLEGVYEEGTEVIVIQDVVTSGTSVFEIVRHLKAEKMIVKTVLAIVDRDQGAWQKLSKAGIHLRSLFVLPEIMKYLNSVDKVCSGTMELVNSYVERARMPYHQNDRLSIKFAIRARKSKNPVAARLLNLMAEKRTTICLAADIPKSADILNLAEVTGPHIAILKIHADMIEDFDEDFVRNLQVIAQCHNFLIMEDRKFADEASVVSLQCQCSIYQIPDWADLVSLHPIPGPSIIKTVKKVLSNIPEPRGIFIIAEVPTKDALTNGDYIALAVNMGLNYRDYVAGYVCHKNVFDELGMVHMSFDSVLAKSAEELLRVSKNIVKHGADVVVVGKAIFQAKDQLYAVIQYKNMLFECYENRVNRLSYC